MKKIILFTLISVLYISNTMGQEEKALTKEDLKEVIEKIFEESTGKTEKLIQSQKKEQQEIAKTNTIQSIKTLVNTLKTEANLSAETNSSLDAAIKDLDSAKPEDLNKIVSGIASKINELIQLNEKEFLGTFALVNDGENIPVRIVDSKEKENNDTINIKKVSIEIKDGVLYDIIAYDKDKENHFFYNIGTTNTYNLNKKRSTLKLYSNLNPKKGDQKYIELIDLVSFTYENGKRYIIDKDLINLTKKDSVHKVNIDNNLKSVIDFRIYSDFLGLINEAPNGIVSFEGSSTFYLNPFDIFERYSYLLKKLKTKIRYSRLEDNDRIVIPTINDELDLLQKSFFYFGGEFDVFEIQFGKKFPYKLITKAKGGLDLTEIGDQTAEDTFTTTTLGLGVGAEMQVERYRNFGLHTSFYFNRYQNNNIIEDSVLNFNTFAINSEVYFYTPGSKNNAIFLRAQYEQGMRDLRPDSNFFTIQFGYKAELNFKSKKEK